MEAFKVAEKVLIEWKEENGVTGPALGNQQKGATATEDPRDTDIGIAERTAQAD